MRKVSDLWFGAASASIVVVSFAVFVLVEGGYSTLSSILRSMGLHFGLWWMFTFVGMVLALFLVDAATNSLLGRSVWWTDDGSHRRFSIGHLVAVTCVAVLAVLTLFVAISRSSS